jgi:hypothetical protein
VLPFGRCSLLADLPEHFYFNKKYPNQPFISTKTIRTIQGIPTIIIKPPPTYRALCTGKSEQKSRGLALSDA